MTLESVEQLLRSLTAVTSGDSAVQVYAAWQGISPVTADDTLTGLVNRVLIANGKASQIGECLESTLLSGGAVGESIEQMLLATGLTGWN